MLINEMFRQRKRRIKFTVGEIVPYSVCRSLPFDLDKKVKLFRKHLYRIGKGRPPLLRTESAVALPERRSDLKKGLRDADLLGKTPDGRQTDLPLRRAGVLAAAARDRVPGRGGGHRQAAKLHDGSGGGPECSRNPFVFSSSPAVLAKEFRGDDRAADFTALKRLLQNMGVSVPPLYKQYAALCEPGGVRFLDFNVDPQFSNCVDGLVAVDIERLTEQKRRRYIGGEFLQS